MTVDRSTGKRSCAVHTYYETSRAWSNLRVFTQSRVTKVLLEDGVNPLRAQGVTMIPRGRKVTLITSKEVILTAGGKMGIVEEIEEV